MISPVDRESLDTVDSEEDQRPEWMKWYYHRWAAATQMMDPEQKGWYMNLLMFAAMQGDPPGYLTEDDEELRYIAGVKELAADALQMQSVEKRWARVRGKFKRSSDFPGLVYNKMLVNTLKEATIKSEANRKAANISWEVRKNMGRNPQNSRKDTSQGTKELAADALQMQSKRNANAMPDRDRVRDRKNKEEKPREKELGLLLVEETEEELILTPPESKPSTSTKNRKQPESVFEEKKFIITPYMKQHLFEKHPEIDNGDLEWMRYKFCNVYHNTRYASWSRCFYNFVFNQITKYNYEPGSYKRLRTAGGKNVPTKQKPWESAPERSSRLEQEAANYTEHLRGGSGGDPVVNSQGLTLGDVHND